MSKIVRLNINDKEKYLSKLNKFLNLKAKSKVKNGKLYIQKYGLFSSTRFPEGNEKKLSDYVRSKSNEFKQKYPELKNYYFSQGFTFDEIVISLEKWQKW